jgi:drug/metabolite transporter (DMT)-like permease
MSPLSVLTIVGTVFLLAVGQVLFKFAADGLDIAQKGFVNAVLLNKWLIVALLVYFVATVLWLLVLRKNPLSLAYPFVALAFVFVPVLGHYLLNEPLRLQSLVGAALIGAGVWVSVR